MNLTSEAIAAVGPINQLLADLLVDLEELDVRNRRAPYFVEAIVRSATVLIVPGTCYRRVFWLSRDMTDAMNSLERLRYDDLAARAGRAAQMISILLEGLDSGDE